MKPSVLPLSVLLLLAVVVARSEPVAPIPVTFAPAGEETWSFRADPVSEARSPQFFFGDRLEGALRISEPAQEGRVSLHVDLVAPERIMGTFPGRGVGNVSLMLRPAQGVMIAPVTGWPTLREGDAIRILLPDFRPGDRLGLEADLFVSGHMDGYRDLVKARLEYEDLSSGLTERIPTNYLQTCSIPSAGKEQEDS
ncbi:MAG: hypothetical protein D6812_06845 [Deltaproteobacteria bacterium]|nr:MAG: hypothetical protein D6812_06845 [Deltaproteobacteria bacterium]